MRVGKRGNRPGAPQRHRGIYLISTLLLLTFLVMLGGAIAVSFQQGLASSGSFNNRQMALHAAMSGLQYVQARLESNPTIYGPGYVQTTYDVLTGTNFLVREKQDTSSRAINICGYLDNTALEGGAESQVRMLFRASFNGSYTGYAAVPTDWSFVNFSGVSPTAWNTSLGAIPQVSMNNLLRSSQLPSGSSYLSSGAVFKQVPGGTADVIIEGLVVRDDGAVVARRSVECVFGLSGSQSPTAPGPATAATDMNFTLYQSESAGGRLTVGVGSSVNAALAENAGLAAYSGNINLRGVDAATSTTAPPQYTASSRASVLANKAFNYSWGSGSQSYTSSTTNQTVVQAQQVTPPAIKADDLPALQNPAALAAGTWVVWNGMMYHYATDYDGSVPLNQQSWTGGTGGTPPTLNSVTPDSQTLPTEVAFDSQSNTISVSSDVQVSRAGGANGFAFVVAPGANQPATGNNSASIGSAQLVFLENASHTPQLRSEGSVTVVGNVTGQGALVSTGLSGGATGSASAGDVTVIGKSSLDSRSDSGVAIYAKGSVNMQQLSFGQAPATVPSVGTTLGSLGVAAGSGNSTTVQGVNLATEKAAVYSAITQAMQDKYNDIKSDFFTLNSRTGLYTLNNLDYHHTDLGSKLRGANSITVVYNGTTYTGKLIDVLRGIVGQAGDTTSQWYLSSQRTSSQQNMYIGNILDNGGLDGNTTNLPALVTQGGWSAASHGAYTITQAKFSNYESTGTSAAVAAPATLTPSASASASPGGTGEVTTAALNQTFSGLVYAGRDMNMRNGLGGITVNGMVVAYGGDPTSSTQQPGTSGGAINLSANNVSLLYDPTTLGPYLYLFGGVKLTITSLSNF